MTRTENFKEEEEYENEKNQNHKNEPISKIVS